MRASLIVRPSKLKVAPCLSLWPRFKIVMKSTHFNDFSIRGTILLVHVAVSHKWLWQFFEENATNKIRNHESMMFSNTATLIPSSYSSKTLIYIFPLPTIKYFKCQLCIN
ncbi:hypothetical protein AAHE18_17G162500 [Arachis hypogaea]